MKGRGIACVRPSFADAASVQAYVENVVRGNTPQSLMQKAVEIYTIDVVSANILRAISAKFASKRYGHPIQGRKTNDLVATGKLASEKQLEGCDGPSDASARKLHVCAIPSPMS